MRLRKLTFALLLMLAPAPVLAQTAEDRVFLNEGGGQDAPMQMNNAVGLPAAIRAAAIAASEVSEGEIAGALIPGTVFYAVYLRHPNWCGSGGCRTQIWTLQDGRPVQREKMTVGHLPIVVLPSVGGALPRLGYHAFDKGTGSMVVVPSTFDGSSWTDDAFDDPLPADTGIAIITDEMLEPF